LGITNSFEGGFIMKHLSRNIMAAALHSGDALSLEDLGKNI